MAAFIEVSSITPDTKVLVNIDQISQVSVVGTLKPKARIWFARDAVNGEWDTLDVKESYEEVKVLIQRAQKGGIA